MYGPGQQGKQAVSLPGYTIEEVRLLTIYPPISVETVVTALGGSRPYDTMAPPAAMGMYGAREVRVGKDGSIELWEMRSVPKEA